jgi:threonine synthase
VNQAKHQAVLTGLAPNGGLYIPTEIPSLPADWETKWAKLSFPELSHEILSLFIPTADIPSEDLKTIIDKSYSSFRDPVTTPLRKTGEKEYVMELWHGPTWAFKDVALQFLGETFAYFLERRNAGKTEGKEELTVVGATSGDTGRCVLSSQTPETSEADIKCCHLRSALQAIHHHLHPIP